MDLRSKEVLSMVSLTKTTMIGMLGLVALTSAVFGARARQNSHGSPASHDARMKLDAHRTLGSPHAYRNLTLIPVYDKTAHPADAFLTLDEGLALKQVSVKESKAGGAVNTLYVTNESMKPLYLMGGEVVLGGQQDRTLGRDTIISPGEKEVPVTVFCVEHGRWTGRKEFDQSAPTVASAEIRASAQEGEFFAARTAAGRAGPAGPNAAANGGISGNLARQSAGSNYVDDAQQQVWDKVAKKNARLKTETSTGSYRAALNLATGDVQKSVPAYLAALSDSLGTDSHLIGVVAAINGKVVAADIFGDPILFHKLWPKLLRSYASDAVEHMPEDTSKVPAATAAQAKAFLVTATDAKSKIENKSDVSSTVRYESGQAVAYSLVPGAKAGGALGAFGGGFAGGAVHTGVLGK
jgi:hypothetical protein